MATLLNELLARIQKTDDCWIWHGRIDNTGYGRFKIKGDKDHGAHRLVYEVLTGEKVPKGLHIDHLCRNPRCVNPTHLEPVTPRENTLRSPIAPAAINARKTACKRGHDYTKMNLYVDPRGRRECRQCRNAAFKRFITRRQNLGHI